MIICKKCGAQNADGAIRCESCGLALGFQMRAQADLQKARTGQVVRTVIRIAIVVLIVIFAPVAYHAGRGAYLEHHLKSIKERASSNCDGPITETMQPSQVDQFNKCMAADPDLQAAQSDYDEFKNVPKK